MRSFADELSEDSYQRQLMTHAFWSSANGLAWGSAALLFQDPSAPIYSLYLICALTGYISVTLISNTLYLPQFLGFVIGAATPYALSYIFMDGTLFAVLFAYALVYTIVMIAFGRIANANYITSKKIEYDNKTLLERITEEKRIANQAIDQKNQFLAATSHDLRQPLHGLGLYIDALEPRMQDPVDVDIVSKLKTSSVALNELLHGLLDISRLDANIVKNSPQHVHLFGLINKLAKEFEVQISHRKLRLELNVDETVYVFVDPILTERVLRNVLSNAIKYTKEGTISIAAKPISDHVEITISDTGIGVAKENLDDIFNEYTQLGNPERDRNKGLGLGLAIVNRLCEIQNVSYTFTSELDVGSTFTLLIEKGNEDLRPLEIKTRKSVVKNLTILVVDDEPIIRDAMTTIIQSWQCQPLTAGNKAQALEALIEHNDDLDLVLCDLRLPNYEDGLTVITAIREELNEEVPAIIVTGDTAVDRLSYVDSNTIELLHKPVRANLLREKIEQLVILNS